MPTATERWTETADGFGAAVDAVTDWSADAPCTGWVAADVVGHLVEWVPGFLSGGGIELGATAADPPSAAEDPVAAWRWVRGLVDAAIGRPGGEDQPFAHPMAGEHPFGVALERFITGDVFIHTWDLARAAGVDHGLDQARAEEQFRGMEPMADMLAGSGHFSERVAVAVDASAVDRLIALTGRDPNWTAG